MSSDQDEFSVLAERAQLVDEFANSQAWELIADYARHLSVADQRKILEGRCENWDEYQELTGKLKGIQLVLRAPAILRAKVEADRARMQGPE